MTRTIFLFLVPALLMSATVLCQNIDFKAGNFKDKKEEYKVAEARLDAGNAFFKEALKAEEDGKDGAVFYLKALDPFLEAHAFNPKNAVLNYRIGKCHARQGQFAAAMPFLEEALRLNEKDCEPDIHLLLGKAYKLENRFNEARSKFQQYKTTEKERTLNRVLDEINREINQCDIAAAMTAKPLERIWVEPMKDWNTAGDDYLPAISADESMVVYNTRRPTPDGPAVETWHATREKGKWQKPQAFGQPFDPAGKYESLALSFDGQHLYLRNLDANPDLFISRLEGKNWSVPLRFPDKINSPEPESGACFSTDGIKIYYVTEAAYGNRGGKDIYFSGIMDRRINQWGEGMTIGSEINTPQHDGFIFMHADGKTIYFASQGHNSMGGYDIFRSTRLAGRWSAPENLGYPINTPFDETSYVLSANGKHAFLTSNRREGGKGGTDIFRVTYLGPVKQPVPDYQDQLLADIAAPQHDSRLEGAVTVESKNLTILKGKILDDFTGQPVGAEIEISDNLKNEGIATFTSNTITGKFLVSLPAGFNYGIAVKAKDYLFHSENFNLPETHQYQLVEKEIRLKGACLGCKIILKNIFFDTGKFSLRPESAGELNRLAELITELARVKPGIKIEISGHTDNVGSESSNRTLSENRARAVVKYLVDHGIGQERLMFKGYGSTQPVMSNNTPEGRQENRRTEFKIVGE